ncbi:MAG: T9SS type A sorting domain-containing protein, partial [Bacteroidia bacterium]|nr:T9SS type A sorting domain-containing protein [Bacteroidia bacterium]
CRDPALVGANLWTEKIVEYQPVWVNGANIVWAWDAWDHLVQYFDNTKPGYDTIAEHPELFDFNYTNGTASVDWLHNNGLDYDSIHDQIVFSSRQMCEIYIIDHSTTTAEAASHTGGNYGKGGDLLYRWGNPEAYGRGTLADRKLFYEHCPRWIPQGFPNAGRISIFNNGNNRPAGNYSSVDVIIPPTDANWNYTIAGVQAFGPDSAEWSYTDPVPTNFYDVAISGAFIMPNGNFIVTDGMNGKIFETDSNKTKLWEYKGTANGSGPATQGTNPSGTNIFKASFYDLSYGAFNGQTLTPGLPIEINPISYTCSMPMAGIDGKEIAEEVFVFPNPAKDIITVKLNSDAVVSCKLYDVSGRVVLSTRNTGGNFTIDVSKLGSGIYFLEVSGNGKRGVKKIIKE